VAALIWLSKNHEERARLSKIDLVLIGIEIFLIIHLFMGFLSSSAVQVEAANLFLGGEFTVFFWVFVVILGLVFPAVLEILELAGKKIPVLIPALLVLLGGLIFRFIMVEAGQITRYLY
jgi:formate-dependent nitrite reductase membrane component NrfD